MELSYTTFQSANIAHFGNCTTFQREVLAHFRSCNVPLRLRKCATSTLNNMQKVPLIFPCNVLHYCFKLKTTSFFSFLVSLDDSYQLGLVNTMVTYVFALINKLVCCEIKHAHVFLQLVKGALQNRHQESEHDIDHFQTSFDTGTHFVFNM